jgi:hypothetical protein
MLPADTVGGAALSCLQFTSRPFEVGDQVRNSPSLRKRLAPNLVYAIHWDSPKVGCRAGGTTYIFGKPSACVSLSSSS